MHAKTYLGIAAFVAATFFGIAGTWIAPTGIIDSSMLYLIAQFLLFSATCVGLGVYMSKATNLIKEIKNSK